MYGHTRRTNRFVRRRGGNRGLHRSAAIAVPGPAAPQPPSQSGSPTSKPLPDGLVRALARREEALPGPRPIRPAAQLLEILLLRHPAFSAGSSRR